METAGAPTPPKAHIGALAAFAVALAALLYGRALGHGFVHDDVALIERSKHLAEVPTWPAAMVHDLFWLADGTVRPSPFWRPLVVSTYYLERAAGGGRPWVFHLSNLVMLAALATVAARRVRGRAALLVAAAIIVHPMMVEPAANITARPDLLAALFAVLAVQSGPLGAAAFTLLALLSKEVAIVVPALVLVARLGRGEQARGALPSLLTALCWLVVRNALVAGFGVADGDLGAASPAGRLASPGLIAFWLGRLAWPWHPIAGRSLPESSPLLTALGVTLSIAALAGTVRALRSRNGELAEAGAWMVLPLVPVSGLLVAAPRYAEGFLCFGVVGLSWLLPRAPRGVGLAAVVVWAAISGGRVGDWSGEGRLWATAIAQRPDDPAVALRRARTLGPDRLEEALRLTEVALRDTDPRRHREAASLRASVLLQLDRTPEALPWLRVAALPEDPEAGWALVTRCILDAGDELPPDAPPLAPACEAALARDPTNAVLWNAAGIEAAGRGEAALARQRFARAVELQPDDATFRANLHRAGG